MIAASNVSPPTLIDSSATTPVSAKTAISVVPPPISTTIWARGSVISSPAPIAAATPCGTKTVLLGPAAPTSERTLDGRFDESLRPPEVRYRPAAQGMDDPDPGRGAPVEDLRRMPER